MPENEHTNTQKTECMASSCQVQEGADHAPVLLLVHRLFILVHVQRLVVLIGVDSGFESSILNLLRMSFVYLA
jgi:hypothetical protein